MSDDHELRLFQDKPANFDLNQCQLDTLTITFSYLTDLHLVAGDIKHTHIIESDLKQSQLIGSSLNRLVLEKSTRQDCNCRETTIKQAQLRHRQVKVGFFSNANLQAASFAVLMETRFFFMFKDQELEITPQLENPAKTSAIKDNSLAGDKKEMPHSQENPGNHRTSRVSDTRFKNLEL